MKENNDLFSIPDYRVRQVEDQEMDKLQALLERCADYILLVDGYPPNPSSAATLISECPEGKSVEDKVVAGIYSIERQMVGVLEAIQDYPLPGDWWIGLLLLDPDFRNQGLGRKIVRSFEGWVNQQGAKRVLLGVVAENDQAYNFWRAVGFEEIQRQPPSQIGLRSHVVITMQHELPGVVRA